MRAFIAVPIPQPVKLAVALAQGYLKDAAADVGWVEPACLHLTLQFLGMIDREQADAAARAIDALAARSSPFTAEITALGAFPTLDRPRVIWFGIDPHSSARVVMMAQECAAALATLGMAPPRDTVSPHVTIGRVRSAHNRFQLKGKITEWNRRHPSLGISFTAGSLTLFQSELSPRGPVHTSLHEATLAIT